MPSPLRLALSLLLLLASQASPAAAQDDSWNPFKPKELSPRERRQTGRSEPEKSPPLPPMGGAGSVPWGLAPPARPAGPEADRAGMAPVAPQDGRVDAEPLPPLDERSRAVERGDLQPAMTADGSGLPAEMWQGVDLRAIEEMLAQLEIPPSSAALNRLWRKLWIAEAAPSGGAGGSDHFEALRLEALHRSGLVAEARARLGAAQGAGSDVWQAVRARIAIAIGERAGGCKDVRRLARSGGAMPPRLKADMLLLSAYCAAADGNRDAAGLALELARGEAAEAPLALGALAAFAAEQPFKPQLPKRVSLLDFRYLELGKVAVSPELVAAAEPALLAALATDASGDAAGRAAVAEAALRVGVIDAQALADAYRAAVPKGGDTGDPLAAPGRGEQHTRRAHLYRAIEAERTPMRKARLIRALLDDARRARLAGIASALHPATSGIAPAQEIGWFAETAIEISLAAGDAAGVRRWLDLAERDRAGQGLHHWLLLADIADAKWPGRRGEGFPAVEQLAVRGQLTPDLLHRLATVLDALDYQIPIPLWEAASRTPQPAGGHLPETGVLSQLQDAAKRREFARTVVLAMRAVGPSTAETAHIIALGDAIRALRRAGLEGDARALALEAVIGAWPRMAAN